ncbi:C-type mannose receptor 2-like [Xyrichtys novacula]|uniref:C-type mannose receptor 2-like n=1 Tax=Xyrichtys novacula TaxID=13765 RepID=A0AAV1HJU2_XYRNO|nr:C-type mannose receptor 2-like [Xyrichtys novacula]
MTWSEAQEYCREHYTDLATVSNMTDLRRLRDLTDKEAWIGLYSQPGKDNRMWHWSQPGVEIGVINELFHNSQPNDNGRLRNCGEIKNHRINDLKCENKREFICFKEVGSDKQYEWINEEMTWIQAQNYCRREHTDLVSGVDQLDDEKFKEDFKDKENLWIGLFRDTWRWSDGSNSSFRKWKEFRDGVKEKKCATVDQHGNWESDDCNAKKPFFCYDDKVILIKEKLPWEDALNYCRWFHSDLASITNHHQQKWVQARAKNASTSHVWLGLYYTCIVDLWFWVSNDLVCYDNWKENDGNNDQDDLTGAMETDDPHKWFKKNDTEKFNFVCATKAVKNPT